jgi:hypothetical protein
VPLVDHATTVAAYLNDYRTESDTNIRHQNSAQFTAYLLSTSWQKMHKRITSWPAIGLISKFHKIRKDELQELSKSYHWATDSSGPGDRTLGLFLSRRGMDMVFDRLQENDGMGSVMKDFSLEKFRSLVGVEPVPVFQLDAENLWGFHCLLVSTLMLYTRTLMKMKRAYSNLNAKHKNKLITEPQCLDPKEKQIVGLFIDLEMYNRLLILIFSSTSFTIYLQIAINAGTLLPQYKTRIKYAQFKVQRLDPNGLAELSSLDDDDNDDELASQVGIV